MSAHDEDDSSSSDEDDSSSSDEESDPTQVDGVIDNGNSAPQVSTKKKGYWTIPIIDGDGVVTPITLKTKERGKYLTGGKKVYITFNGGFVPTGVDDTCQFIGQIIGEMGRYHKLYPIPYKDWRHMKKELNDRAWKTLFLTQIHVDDSEIEAVRRYIESVIAERWKKYKLDLYKTHFIERQLPDEEKRKQQETNKTKRNLKKINHRSDSCPNHGGRMNMRLSMLSLPPEVTYSSPCTKEKTGSTSDEAKAVGERIEEIQTLGLALRNVAPDDAFALALDKPEHPGRVRGLGYGVVPSKVFGGSANIRKRSRYNDSKVTTLKDQLRQTQEKQKQMEAQVHEAQAQIQFLMSQLGTNSSSTPIVSPRNHEQIDLNARGLLCA